jgi:tetratricopeptide (TPR) repeat protein
MKGANVEPGMVIATADFLVLNKKWDHAAEFLKANLREGVVVQPWVFKSLSLALREAGAKADEIERAEVSIADMEPLDAQGYLVAARALADDKNYQRAIAFCKQAANLLPGTPVPFAEAARFAEMANDANAMEWAAGNLLKQEWPTRNDELKQTTLGRVEALARTADKATAERLKATIHTNQRRDLVIKLLWQGEADLDLKIQEPTGAICSSLNRQSIGGGTLLADSFTAGTGETYTAAEAFSGEYKVFVDRIWGKPLGSKAQVKIIRNQGTPEETEQLIPLKIDSDSVLAATFKLETGRRTETAYVPPSSVHSMLDSDLTPENRDEVVSKLINLSDPEVTGMERGFAGGVGGGAVAPRVNAAPIAEAPKALDKAHTLYQSRIRSLVKTGADVTAQAVLSADRRSVHVNVKPVFNTLTDSKPVKVLNPVIPGAGLSK